MSDFRPEIVTKPLPCILTEAEIVTYARAMSEQVSDRDEAKDTLESFKKQQNATIAEHEAKINAYSNKINAGREYRPVDCKVEYDWDRGVVAITRMDTAELVGERKILPEERQEYLNLTQTAEQKEGTA